MQKASVGRFFYCFVKQTKSVAATIGDCLTIPLPKRFAPSALLIEAIGHILICKSMLGGDPQRSWPMSPTEHEYEFQNILWWQAGS